MKNFVFVKWCKICPHIVENNKCKNWGTEISGWVLEELK
jgi:hypothetical protein